MAREAVEVALRACIEETNRLNWLRRDVWFEASTELASIAKSKKDIVTAIENGRYSETLMDRLLEFEAREKVLKQCMSEGPADVPDVHPNIAELYARKVGRRRPWTVPRTATRQPRPSAA